MVKRGLGKGLDALFENYDSNADAIQKDSIQIIKISEIDPDREQPRKQFDEAKIYELSESIKKHGVIQPIIVKPNGKRFTIIAGERRWRAARLAGLIEIPVIIREYSDREIREVSLIENLQREDLNPIEEAEGIKQLMDEYGLTQDGVAQAIGRSRPSIANALRLLSLPDQVKELLKEGKITSGHGKVIAAITDDRKKIEIANIIVEKELSVREAEKLVKEISKEKKQRNGNQKPNYIREIESGLEECLGTKVNISPGKKKGIIQIEYYNNEDLERIIDMFNK